MRVVVPAFAESPPEAIDTLTLDPMDQPAPGPRDAVIAVKSAAVGWVDLLMTSGQYQHMPHPPYTPGLECAGEVIAAGPESPAKLGDRVIVDGMYAGPRSLGAYQQWGGWAKWVVAPPEALHPIPGALSFDEAAALLGSYETAYHCLIARGRLQAGETVLIHGATGATGLAAVQLAKLLGAIVIATGRSEAKLAIVKEHGADHVLPSTGFADRVKELGGAHVVYDGVGGEISIESLRCVRFGARFLIVGWASTPNVARGRGQRGAPNANQLPTNLMMMKALDVLGCPMVMSTVKDPSIRAPRLRAVLEWAAQGKIKPHVSHRFPLAEFKSAMRAKWNGEVVGGCVLQPT